MAEFNGSKERIPENAIFAETIAAIIGNKIENIEAAPAV